MSFISLPQEFHPETGVCRSFQIALQDDGVLTPVGFLRGDEGLPIELRKLAENFAAMLNGNNPLYHFGGSHEMYYEKHAGGMNFRFRDKGADGVSHIGALLTLLPGVEMEFAE